jgi:hypothetical protein
MEYASLDGWHTLSKMLLAEASLQLPADIGTIQQFLWGRKDFRGRRLLTKFLHPQKNDQGWWEFVWIPGIDVFPPGSGEVITGYHSTAWEALHNIFSWEGLHESRPCPRPGSSPATIEGNWCTGGVPGVYFHKVEQKEKCMGYAPYIMFHERGA